MSALSNGQRLTAMVAVMIGAIAVTAGIALAAKFPSSVSLDSVDVGPHSATFRGEVESDGPPKCVNGREVTVREMKGEEPASHDHPVAPPATTDEAGAYEVDDHSAPHDGDKFYAEVAKRKFGRKGHRKTCLGAQSSVYTYSEM